jgi:hypothetical protein
VFIGNKEARDIVVVLGKHMDASDIDYTQRVRRFECPLDKKK